MLIQGIINSIRFIKRHRTFAAINITGLTIGIFSCLLIILYIHSELTFDKFHTKGENIYRVVMHQPGNQVVGSSSEWWVVSPAILKPTWENELPEVDLVTRTISRKWTFKLQDRYMNEEILVVDPEFFEIFSFPLKSGDQSRVLQDPYSIILSQEMALKYFGEDDPMGRQMILNEGKQLTITGILEDVPGNSHLQFDILASFKTLESILGRSLLSENWLNNSYRTYLTLHENADLEFLDAKLRKYDIEGFNESTWTFHLQPLYDIHFNRQIRGAGDKGTLFIFLTAGVFILFIACFNYLNLYIAHHRTRLKDLSIRKLLGAKRSLLIRQFFSESLVLVLISYLVALLVVWLVLPLFNATLEQNLNFSSLWNMHILLVSLGLILLMAFISGVYPAVYLSRFQMANALRGGMIKLSRGSQQFRKAIVIIQFSISIALIMCSATIIKQLSYANNKDLGYRKENIIYLNLINLYYAEKYNLISRITTFKQELLRHPDILAVAASTGIPSNIGWSNIPVWEGKDKEDNPFFYRMIIDYDFLDLYGIQLESGRNFSTEMGTDKGNAYIINKAAADRMDLQSPIGAKFGFDGKLGTVVGLTGDFYFESLHKPITPLGIGVTDEHYWSFVSIKVGNTNMQKILKYIEETWKNYIPDIPMDYSFFDERLERLYLKDQQISKSMNYLSMMALLISCLGIFGLISLSLKERTREIGIRKVIGASYARLLNLLARDYVFIVLIATIFGGALGWYLSIAWLNNFAYRCRFGFDVIIISAILTLLMSMLMISFKLIKAVTTNPVESLRVE
ncbi:MAG: ABC transporter permease [Bacteroidales bacterium]|nr:MAG: ABC transporter permease [Bacteroidales bacterium]